MMIHQHRRSCLWQKVSASTLALVLWVLVSPPLVGQKLQDNFRQSRYTYVFRLDTASAAALFRERHLRLQPDTRDRFFSQPVDSFLYNESFDFTKLGPGIFLSIRTFENQVYYETQENPAFRVQAHGLGDEIRLFLTLPNGERVEDASLQFIRGGKSIGYDPVKGAYAIPVNPKKPPSVPFEFLIVRGKDLQFGAYSFNSPEQPVKRPWWKIRLGFSRNYGVYNTLLPGYLVLNQPRFKPLDSLLWKAFLVKPNGKPYRKPVRVHIRNEYDNSSLFHRQIRPISPGAFTGRLFLSDSFLVDRSYALEIFSKRGRLLKTESFRIENYRIERPFLTSSMEKDIWFAGDPIQIVTESRDINGLGLPDARIRVEVEMINLEDFFTDTLFIPFGWNQHFWGYEGLADPSGISRIVIPDSLFPNARMRFRARVTLSVPDGDIRTFEHIFVYNPTEERYTFIQKGDSLLIRYLVHSAEKPRQALLRARNGILLYERPLTLPATLPAEDYPTDYELVVDNQVVHQFQVEEKMAGLIRFEGSRTWDSLTLDLINPPGVEVTYRVFMGDQNLFTGRDRKFHRAGTIGGSESVHLEYTFRWQGVEYLREQSFHCLENSLKVDMDQPGLVYPGQKVPVTVRVSDYKGRPRKNVNLTAYAVNRLFEDLRTPLLPYLGKQKPNLSRGFTPLNMWFRVYNTLALDRYFINRLHLGTNPFYQLFYDPKGIGMVNEAISDEDSEIQAYVTKKGVPQVIYSLFLDQKPVFFNFLNTLQSPSVGCKKGVHSLQIRTREELITIDSVVLETGNKLFLCLNLDSLKENPRISRVRYEDPFPEKEAKLLQKYILAYRPDFRAKNNDIWFVQNKLVLRSLHFNHSESCSPKEAFYSAGPFLQGMVQVMRPGRDTTSFYFDPSMAYLITDSAILAVDPREKDIRFPLRKEYIPGTLGLSLTDRRLRTPVPSLEEPEKPPPPPPQPRRPNPALTNYGLSYSAPPFAHLILRNQTGNTYNFIWLFNEENDTASRIQFHPGLNLEYLKPGNYSLVMLKNDGDQAMIRKLSIKGNGSNYLNLKSTDFQPVDSLLLEACKDRIIRLNLPKPREFTNPPIHLSDIVLEPRIGQGATQLTGYLLDVNGNPIDMATIFLEEAGVFVKGALTNPMGYFQMQPKQAGVYQLKIFLDNKFYVVPLLKLREGRHTEIRIAIPEAKGFYYTRDLNQYSEPGMAASYAATPMDHYSISSLDMIQETSIMGRFNMLTSISTAISSLGGPYSTEPTSSEPLQTKSLMKSLFMSIRRDTSLRGIRNRFRDYAYFVPNLITNRKGEAHFTVEFPDNQTAWNSFVPAMDYHGRTGLGMMITRSFKPLSAGLAVPGFLVVGDSLLIRGRVANYTGETQSLRTVFLSESDTLVGFSHVVSTLCTDSIYFAPKRPGSARLAYSLTTDQGYSDGEERLVEVHSLLRTRTEARHHLLNGDTLLQFAPDTSLSKRSFVISNHRFELVMEQIARATTQLCFSNDEKASKLKILVVEKTIREALGLEFGGAREIRSLVRDLTKSQHPDGSWGWWPLSPEAEMAMTCRITEALQLANQAGFFASAQNQGAAFLRNKLPNLAVSEKIQTLLVLARFFHDMDYLEMIQKMEEQELNRIDRFRLIRLRQIRGLNHSVREVTQTAQPSPGSIHWEDQGMGLKLNALTLTELAYEILQNEPGTRADTLSKIRGFLFENLTQADNLSEKARMLQTLLNDLKGEGLVGKEVKAKLKINGKAYEPESRPLRVSFQPNESIRIEKSGAPLYCTEFRETLFRGKALQDSLFSIQTRIESGLNNQGGLTVGQEVVMTTEIQVKEDQEFVEVDIPFPSSCTTNQKFGISGYEDHRETLPDQVRVFFRHLPRGTHQIRLGLTPRFSGISVLKSARIFLVQSPDRMTECEAGKVKTF